MLKNGSQRWHISLIVGCGVVVRLMYHLAYQPWWCGDSIGYSRSFWEWAHGTFPDAGRPPIYPLFLGFAQWICGSQASLRLSVPAAYTTVILQNLLGLAAACLLYRTLRFLRSKVGPALVAALVFCFIGAVAQFETLILTESLSLFSLVLAAYLFVRTMQGLEDGRRVQYLAFWTGLAFSFAVLVRLENLVFFVALLLVLGALFLRLRFRQGRAQQTRALAKVLLFLPLGLTPLLLAWMTLNRIGIRQFTLTTITGPQMTQSVYNLFDKVDPEDRVLREVMNRYYRETNTPGHVDREFFWRGHDELIARYTELPIKVKHWDRIQIDVNAYVGRVCWKLVRKYPGVWLRNAAGSFPETFNFRFTQTSAGEHNDPQSVNGGSVIRRERLWRTAVWLNRVEAPFLTLLYCITLFALVAGAIALFRGRNEHLLTDVTVCALAAGTVGTFAAICLLESFHNQYAEPHLGVLLMCSFYLVHRGALRNRWRRRKSNVGESDAGPETNGFYLPAGSLG